MSVQRMTPLAVQNEGKFIELVLYITPKRERDPDFGRTRLYNALFDVEWTHYIATGSTITGQTYVKGPHGPMPERGEELLSALEERRLLAIQNHCRTGYPQQKPVALRDADLSVFTPQEIAIVDQVLEDRYATIATGISDQHHSGIAAWEIAQDGEAVPFETSWVAPRRLTADEIAYGLHLSARLHPL